MTKRTTGAGTDRLYYAAVHRPTATAVHRCTPAVHLPYTVACRTLLTACASYGPETRSLQA